MVLNIPEWGVVLSLISLAVLLSGFIGAIYARIGRLEGTVTAKLNGNFSKLVTDVTDLKEAVVILKHEVPIIRDRYGEIKANCLETAESRFQLAQDLSEIKKDVEEIFSHMTRTIKWDGQDRRGINGQT